MTQVELENWETENSFKSYRSVLVDADREWAAMTSEDQKPVFLEKYRDVLSITDSTIVPHIKIFTYQAITNREGIYKTGDHFQKVIGDFIVTVKDKDYRKLNSLSFTNGIPKEGDGIRVFQYTFSDGKDSPGNARTQAAVCDRSSLTYRKADYFLNPSGCKNDRIATLTMDSWVSLFTGNGIFNGTERYGDYYTSRVDIYVWGDIKNWLCSWSGYATQCEIRSVEFDMTGPKTIGYETHRSLWTSETKRYTVANQSSITDTYKYRVIVQIGDVQFNNRPPAYAFSYVYAEGKTRGVGENWAIIYCPN